MRRYSNKAGFTLVEVLITILISSMVISAGYKFYAAVQSQTLIQIELSNIQHTARSTIDDIKTTIRQAGYKLDGHDAYSINGDMLTVFYSRYNTVDTVSYFLLNAEQLSVTELDIVLPLYRDNATYSLIKQTSFGSSGIYADNIVSVKFLKISDNVIRVTVTTQAEFKDEAYKLNNGFHRWTLSEEVCMRNI